MRIAILLSAFLLFACAAEAPAAATPPAEPDLVRLPAPSGADVATLQARLCRPATPAPHRLVVINHGSPANAAARPTMRPTACDHATVRWFTDRGLAVLLPLRRGYGATGGAWAERFGACATPDFFTAGRETARDIQAALAWGVAQPWAQPTGAVVVGQSAGGWGTLALAGVAPPQVSHLVNMAGGRGGWSEGRPNTNCSPSSLAQAAGRFGQGARTPVLSVYTANDTFFDPAIASAIHAAFTGAGGRAELRQLPGFGNDGHNMFFGNRGPAVWGPIVAPFIGVPAGG
jgi:dienelactone hydrolase